VPELSPVLEKECHGVKILSIGKKCETGRIKRYNIQIYELIM